MAKSAEFPAQTIAEWDEPKQRKIQGKECKNRRGRRGEEEKEEGFLPCTGKRVLHGAHVGEHPRSLLSMYKNVVGMWIHGDLGCHSCATDSESLVPLSKLPSPPAFCSWNSMPNTFTLSVQLAQSILLPPHWSTYLLSSHIQDTWWRQTHVKATSEEKANSPNTQSIRHHTKLFPKHPRQVPMQRAFWYCNKVKRSYSVCVPVCLSVWLAQSIVLPPHWRTYLLSYHPTNPNLEIQGASKAHLEATSGKKANSPNTESIQLRIKTFPYLGANKPPTTSDDANSICYCNTQCPDLLLRLSVGLAISIYTTPTTLAHLLTCVPPNQSQPINSRYIQGTCWKHLHPERKQISQTLNQSSIQLI